MGWRDGTESALCVPVVRLSTACYLNVRKMRESLGQLSFTVFAVWTVSGCIASSPTRGALPEPGHSTVTAASPPNSPAAPEQTSNAPAIKASKRPTTTPGPVVPPEHLPDFDAALVRSLGTDGLRKLEVAASMCPAAVLHGADKLRVGCRACPPFDASTGPDGKVVIDPPDGGEFYELEKLVEGHFTEPSQPQLAAVFTGCESHADNWGGTLLAERSGAVWVQKSYRSGFHPASCKTFRKPDAHDILICTWETDHQSSAHWLLDTYDFKLGDSEHPENGWNNLLTVDDNSISGCLERPSHGGPITADKITSFVTQPGTAQSPPKLVVTVRFARGPITAAFRTQCAKLAKTKTPVDLGATIKSETRDLVLVWDGKNFVPDANSRSTMKRFGLAIEEPATPAKPCSSPNISPAVIRAYCKDGMYKAIVLKNSDGLIGGYVLQPSIMDAPIPYLDCKGEPLTSFHIFATDAEKANSMKIIDPLRRDFPIEERLDCSKAGGELF